ncbi:MAG: type A chloramphenicol O-acetyltransferase [Clostridiaceae bacterium]|nr:type A chloramphenicol O-acetyltransferase [Clostridiaceae bacterium]
MHFEPIDLSRWERAEYFTHYLHEIPCTYSMTVRLDITKLKQSGKQLYAAMLYALAKAVNAHPEFRMALDEDGKPGVYDRMHPCYTVFHKDTQTFSNLWTVFDGDYAVFCQNYQRDMETYGSIHRMDAKPGLPENSFTVSMLPWASFEGFNLNLQKGYAYLKPIFTIGKYTGQDGRYTLPLAVQVHHAVCDGFHACRLVDEVQATLDSGLC